ncbi:glycosyltransferase family 4 protein [Cloacibacterium sp. TD35]|uniref:glycosyltransferase family 4 protein n=1 Tax=Cloacibacterium sp. TD35 TaxID=2976818 RepID=UPI00237E27E3|nr:MraY family glycosyltransferase [Cloacibacterium sp. TD35]WDT68390.1 undecaprenyl/decaprenyl-phosphate alpha-N-acetylglucosaminyl 1-phosphate transferase [Cloacibacterium sp. TD35]
MDKIDSFLATLNFPVFYLKVIFSFITSLLITYYSIPTIIKISRRKNLIDEPGQRSSHERKIPNLGGVAIFFAISVTASIYAYQLFDLYKFLFASLVILLYIGVMDDIVVMRAYKKLIVQLVVSAMLVIGSDVRIRNLFGVFGVYELNYFFSVIFSIVTFIILVNAFNLIDGIDGLAGTYGLICFGLFGISYYRLGEYNYPLVILSTTIMGSVIGFLYYNFAERSKKIFMGDTGSMVLGFLLTFTAICFIDIFIAKRGPGVIYYHLNSAPVIAVAILILPIIDTLNVIIVRLAEKRSPFEADKNHIHHKLLKMGFSHKRATLYIISYYLLIVSVAYIFRHIENNSLLVLIISLGFLGAYLPDILMKKKINN